MAANTLYVRALTVAERGGGVQAPALYSVAAYNMPTQ